ncbi:MAG: cell division protein FtsA [Candidatus Rokuibacteriota bacterium]|nr:MAG: cell division protein FtsA [Candidatus Rokubacteria bacterium]
MGGTVGAARRRARANRAHGRGCHHDRSSLPRPGRPEEGRPGIARKGLKEYVVGLDVGTTKICAVIAEPNASGSIDVVGVGTAPSRGLRKGVVVNIDATVEAIRQAVGEAEQMAGVEVSGVYAGIAGGHIRGVNSRGVVAVGNKDREVSVVDVQRAIDAARAINLPQDREIIHVLPQTFVVDEQDGIREPVGMTGVRLEVEVHIVTGAITSVHNVVRSVNRAGLTVYDIVLEPFASAEAVLYSDERELGVVLLDIGGGTTDVGLFRDGAIWHTAILPVGGDHITNDIAVGLRTPAAEAEDLKRRYGCALTTLISGGEMIDVPSVGGRKPRPLSRQILSEIIQPRVEEIFTLVARELTKAGFQDAATAGVVVTGGTSIMEGIPELAEAVFDLPVRRGLPETVGGLADIVKSPIYATAVGLALYGARRPAVAGTPAASAEDHLFGRIAHRLAGWFSEVF